MTKSSACQKHQKNSQQTNKLGQNVCYWCHCRGASLPNERVPIIHKKQTKKRANNLNRWPAEQEIQMTLKYNFKSLCSHVIKEAQIKTTLKCTLLPITWIESRQPDNTLYSSATRQYASELQMNLALTQQFHF